MPHDAETARRLVFHLDNLLHARVHTMLIVQALLFVAAMSRDAMRAPIAIAAIVLTLTIAAANVNIAHKLRWTMARWEETEPSGLIRDYASQRTGLPRSISIYTRWIPGLLIAAWVALLVI